MIYFGILSHFEGDKLMFSDELQKSLINQTAPYSVILAVNNSKIDSSINLNCVDFESIIYITGNNIGFGRNQIINRFKSIAKPEDKLFLMDGDDVLDPIAAEILYRVNIDNGIIPVINFSIRTENTLQDYIKTIRNNQIKDIPAFNWYLWNLDLLERYNVVYNQGDFSHDDLHLYLKLSILQAKYKFVTNSIQIYNETGSGNGTIRARAQNVADYLQHDIQYKFEYVETVYINTPPIPETEIIHVRAPRDRYAHLDNQLVNPQKLNNND